MVHASLSGIPNLLVVTVMVAPWLLTVKFCYVASILGGELSPSLLLMNPHLWQLHPWPARRASTGWFTDAGAPPTTAFPVARTMVRALGPARNTVLWWALWLHIMNILQHTPSHSLFIPSSNICHESSGISSSAGAITFSRLLRATLPWVCPTPWGRGMSLQRC